MASTDETSIPSTLSLCTARVRSVLSALTGSDALCGQVMLSLIAMGPDVPLRLTLPGQETLLENTVRYVLACADQDARASQPPSTTPATAVASAAAAASPVTATTAANAPAATKATNTQCSDSSEPSAARRRRIRRALTRDRTVAAEAAAALDALRTALAVADSEAAAAAAAMAAHEPAVARAVAAVLVEAGSTSPDAAAGPGASPGDGDPRGRGAGEWIYTPMPSRFNGLLNQQLPGVSADTLLPPPPSAAQLAAVALPGVPRAVVEATAPYIAASTPYVAPSTPYIVESDPSASAAPVRASPTSEGFPLFDPCDAAAAAATGDARAITGNADDSRSLLPVRQANDPRGKPVRTRPSVGGTRAHKRMGKGPDTDETTTPSAAAAAAAAPSSETGAAVEAVAPAPQAKRRRRAHSANGRTGNNTGTEVGSTVRAEGEVGLQPTT
jgi:hypothetical protein